MIAPDQGGEEGDITMTRIHRVAALGAAAALGAGLVGAAGAAEVRVVVSEYSAATGPIFEGMAEEFEAKHPDIDIRIEVVSWDTLEQKLTTDIAGGTPPDISIIGTRWLVGYVEEGVAEPLDGYMSDEFRARFIETFLEPSVIDGQVYGLPVAASARAMYYNKDLLEQAGIAEPPATWEELREAAGAIDALGDDVHGFGLQGKEIETDAYWYYALWSFGGDILEDGRSGIASEEAIAAAEFYKGMLDDGLTQPEVTGYNRQDIESLFKRGQLGLLLSGPWLRGQLQDEAPDVDYGIAPIPEHTARATYGVTDSIIMFSSSEVKDEAWMFLEEVAFSDEWRREFTLKEGFLPVFKSVAEDPHFAEDEGLQALTSLLPHARFAPTIARWEEMADATSRALQEIYLGQTPPEAALQEAAARIDGLLGN
jgi:multiple sugar transport system substrate-binding protein